MGATGEPFRILKFRTMTADADARKAEVAHLNKHLRRRRADVQDRRRSRGSRASAASCAATRSTSCRSCSTCCAGEMSLVGPRPLILEEHHHVDGWARRRLDLKPGITGLWQVLGRDDIPFGEMVGLDYRYVTTGRSRNDIKLDPADGAVDLAPRRPMSGTVAGTASPTSTPSRCWARRCFVGRLDEAAAAVVDRAVSGAGGYVVHCNVHVLMTAQKDPSAHARAAAAPGGSCRTALPSRGSPGDSAPTRATGSAGPILMKAVMDRGRAHELRHCPLRLDARRRRVARSAAASGAARAARSSGTVAPPFGQEHERRSSQR